MNSKAILMLTLSNVGIGFPSWAQFSLGGCLVWHFHIIFEYYMRISISSLGLQQNVPSLCPDGETP